MDTIILDGRSVGRRIRETLRIETAKLVRKPGLAVVLAGDDPASKVYVSNKEKACAEIGYLSRKITLPATVTQKELLATVEQLNADPDIHGLLVQFPLPRHLSAIEANIIRMIAREKDVDGFHPSNIGAFMTAGHGSRYEDFLLPCTPIGVIRILKEYGIQISGKHVVIIGRSNLVGKPLAMMFLAEDATVTICHTKTSNLPLITKQADILVTATGKPNTVTADMVRDGAVVIDVGINQTENGFIGDVDFEHVAPKTSAITPVPGGIGPMTIAMLMENVMKAYRQQTENRR